MERSGTTEKALLALTAFGVLLTVVALALFALTGSGFVTYVLLLVGGLVLGQAVVFLLTGSRRRGRLVAAALLVLVVACFVAVFARPGWALAFVEHRTGWARFASGLAGGVAGASLVRLLGLNVPGPRRTRASRRG